MVAHRPLLTEFGGSGGKRQAIFPAAPLWGREGNEEGARSRPYCLLGLKPLPQKLTSCVLPPFLHCHSYFKEFPAIFLENCDPPAYFRRKGQLVDLFRDDVSSPEDLMVLANLPSLSRGRYSPRNQRFLPVTFLQRVQSWSQRQSCPSGRASPWRGQGCPLAVSGDLDAVFGDVCGQRQDKMSYLPHSATLSHAQTSLHALLEVCK